MHYNIRILHLATCSYHFLKCQSLQGLFENRNIVIMASRFAVVILSLWVLHSSNAAYRNVRQDSPPLIKNCSTQEEQEFRRAFEQECMEVFDQAIDFSNVSTILTRPAELSHSVTLCSDLCLPSVLAHLRGCYGAHNGLALLYEDSCLSKARIFVPAITVYTENCVKRLGL
jgi:hypothetical protein